MLCVSLKTLGKHLKRRTRVSWSESCDIGSRFYNSINRESSENLAYSKDFLLLLLLLLLFIIILTQTCKQRARETDFFFLSRCGLVIEECRVEWRYLNKPTVVENKVLSATVRFLTSMNIVNMISNLQIFFFFFRPLKERERFCEHTRLLNSISSLNVMHERTYFLTIFMCSVFFFLGTPQTLYTQTDV